MAAPGYGGKKGAAYERTLAVMFSLWISDGKREDILWRTAMSGGRATVKRSKGKSADAQAGDLGSIDPMGDWFASTFLIEAKRYHSFEWHRDVAEPSTATATKATKRPLEIFLHTRVEAKQSGRFAPLVILRGDRCPDLVMTTGKGYRKLCPRKNSIKPTATFPHHDCVVFRLDALIGGVNYEDIKK
jgi:hypothetical protein